MDNFQAVLDKISEIVQRYDSPEILQDEKLKDMHRHLSANLYFLNEHRIAFKKSWDAYYSQSKEGTNAAKERYADRMCPERYMARRLFDAGENVLISINNQLKY
jgi:hypothetical protein